MAMEPLDDFARDNRQVIDGILHRVRTGVQWRNLPERFGPWKTVYERHRLWSADGTWERLLQQVQAAADVSGEIDWDISVDSTIVRAHQHAAGARTGPPRAPASRGAEAAEHQGETPWQSLLARLVEVVREVRALAARGADSPTNFT
ncbi:transposase [Streptomyces cellulosae]